MNNLDKSVLTLNRLILGLSESEHKCGMEDETDTALTGMEGACVPILSELILDLSESEHKRGMEDEAGTTLIDMESAYEFDGLEDYTLLQRPRYSPFAGWGSCGG